MRETYYISAFAEYAKRQGAYCRFDLVALPEQRLPERPSQKESHAALEKQAQAIRARIPKGAAVMAMCVEGKLLSSEALARQLAGERVERGAQQRDVQHGIAAQQQSQHPGLIHGPEPFHFPSYIRQRRPVLPLATSFPMRIHCKIACPFSRDRGGKTVRRERHLKMT